MRGGRGNGERADESGRMQSLRWGFARGWSRELAMCRLAKRRQVNLLRD